MAEPCLTPFARLDPARREKLRALPRSLAILLENVLVHEEDAEAYIAPFEQWLQNGQCAAEIPFRPSRILMQDTAGVAALADLAALRDHARAHGRATEEVDATIPVDLVIDHSVRVDHSGSAGAARLNIALEFARNAERYGFFKWAEQAFPRLSITPPGHGICHQINLERLANVAMPCPDRPGWVCAETVIGTDSHTTMVNALGIMGWGVGGIEAEFAALGAPVPSALPQVCAVRLIGKRHPGVTATDIALALTARLRREGVVDQIVEFMGEGLSSLSLTDRACIANMCPEYGATAALFPVDEATLAYLREMGREEQRLADARAYAEATGLWRDAGPERRYSRTLDIALDAMEPVMAGPHRPQQLLALSQVPKSLESASPEPLSGQDGALAIAAITSCTNTANPRLMIAAGLLARKAVEKGLRVSPWVKASLAPGSRHIAALLERAGLQAPLDALGFHVVGFGCTTCVGNSGELVADERWPGGRRPALLAALLSGNRNFENRIHPAVGANYLASPPLVVAGALAGSLRMELGRDPLGLDEAGKPVLLADIWPDDVEIDAVLAALGEGGLRDAGDDGDGDAAWHALPAPVGPCFDWDGSSSFIRPPPFFARAATPLEGDIALAAVLLWLGDDVTTDHISPIGRIAADSPAGLHLLAQGQAADRLGSYGDRRANHEVMLRGTFDNARLQNRVAPHGGNVALGPDGAPCPIFDAAAAYARTATPVVILAGANYGTGSARDWAAKGTALLGVRAVIAESFERIHRSNLIALGVLPVVAPGVAALAATPGVRVTVRGVAEMSVERPGLIVEIGSSAGEMVASLQGMADVRTESQLAMLRAGGLFAMLAARYA